MSALALMETRPALLAPWVMEGQQTQIKGSKRCKAGFFAQNNGAHMLDTSTSIRRTSPGPHNVHTKDLP